MTDVDVLAITIPAVPRFARLARLFVAGVASRSGFTYDEVEDVRIATGEVLLLLVTGADPLATVHLRCTVDGSRLTVEATRQGGDPNLEVGHLSEAILDAVTDGATFGVGAASVTYAKTAGASP